MDVSSTTWGRSFEGRFMKTVSETARPAWVDAVSSPFNSDQESENYRWLGSNPPMEEWHGERTYKTLRANAYTLENKLWHVTIGLSIDDIRRQKFQQIDARIDQLAISGVVHPTKLLTTRITSGTSNLAYDGIAFFSASHVEGSSGTQSNLTTSAAAGGSTTPTAADMELGINKILERFAVLKDDQGEPFEGAANESIILMVPPNMRTALRAVLGAEVIADGGNGARTNLVRAGQDFNVVGVVNRRLPAGSAIFYAFRVDANVKPFILQSEVPLTPDTFDGDVFKSRHVMFGATAIYNIGYGYWQLAIQHTLT